MNFKEKLEQYIKDNIKDLEFVGEADIFTVFRLDYSQLFTESQLIIGRDIRSQPVWNEMVEGKTRNIAYPLNSTEEEDTLIYAIMMFNMQDI